ncbi:MAG TPA: DUF2064 domain-containing protein [Pseudonocardiaceae bacterium]|jgi:hypothetical protein|nr:DUF2064 domain-containing protein [Pseudonocardiaceae bacterium]
MESVILLLVAKAPVAGLAKTRLCPPASPDQAADIAAAALLDTLTAVLDTPAALPMVAITGDLGEARRAAEIRRLLALTTVIPQRGNTFADRLANAHADASAVHPRLPVVQIGMDTPQVTPDLLAGAAGALDSSPAVLGPATDGGWWALGLRDPRHAQALRAVPMSRSDTAERTRRALPVSVVTDAILSDVDTMADAERVAVTVPDSRFARAVAAVRMMSEAG